MELTSVIIPARNERFLDNTIQEIYDKTGGAVEVIVNLDGPSQYFTKKIAGVQYIENEKPIGMRAGINKAAALARGKYLLKIDAHCMLDKHYDLKLIAEHKDNWVQIPTRKRLDAYNWCLNKDVPDVNLMYINSDYKGVVNRHQTNGDLIHDTETFQGSCYFINKDLFERLGLMGIDEFGPFGHEAQEIGFKVRANGGRVIRNKKTWYAHARIGRKYKLQRWEVDIEAIAKKYGYKRRS
jgi:glycosyltransferase involved in cell wall biosynthesis